MRNFKMTIQYDGSRYKGWQRQTGKDKLLTIQGKIEDVLSIMTGEEIEVIGCGRTDKGVHAERYIANFQSSTEKDTNFILKYLYEYLPEDIAIISIEEVDKRFHARYNVKSKTYMYTIDNNMMRNVFIRKFALHCNDNLNIESMKKASKSLLGTHDFQSFTTFKGNKSTVRTVEEINLKEENGIISIVIKGDGFLWNMVRIIVGTLIEVGKGNIQIEEIDKILEKKERAQAGPMAPAKGLKLIEVNY